RTTVESTGSTTSPAATGSPAARAIAGPASRRVVYGVTLGTAPTIERSSSAMNPIPAAAAVEPVTVLARNVMAAQAPSSSQASIPSAIQPWTLGGANRIAV